jgi:archaellum component FlaC
LTSVVKMSTEVYQKIFHPTIEDTISGYKKQIKHKQEEIALIHERIEKLKSTKQY